MVIVVLGSVLIGVVITAVLGFIIQARQGREISRLTRENNQLREKEEKLQLKIRKLEDKLEENGLSLPDYDSPEETPH
jgi:cell division protein FtsB